MALNLTQQLIRDHLVNGRMDAGEEIEIRIDQTLTQDATGTLVMLELESMGLDRVRTEASVQYVDHNLLQVDHKNPDDHEFLRSACRRFGVWFSRPGNGVSHPLHQEHFAVPGKTLLGADSHTAASGAIAMLAIGAGGLDVAMAMAGQPFAFRMPDVWRVELTGGLPQWVSAKDVILEMLRRHGVDGAVGCVLEYDGPGLECLSVMDRHVIANMGAELGATSTVFPSDKEVRRFLREQGRENDWRRLSAEDGAKYDRHEVVDLSSLEPLIAKPSSPGNVVPVKDVAGEPISQSYVGSSANPGYRDFAMVARIVEGRRVHENVSLDINPTTRDLLEALCRYGDLAALLRAGARLHQAGCNGCIGMGQAPATRKVSLRTVPRNFPGRSGTREDAVYLVSPETAAASALTGVITDPRTLAVDYPSVADGWPSTARESVFTAPLREDDMRHVSLEKGPNIVSLPEFEHLPDELRLEVALKVGNDISTDEILPAGARVLPLRSNIPKISAFCFDAVDDSYHRRATEARERGGHAIVGGDNYGQGSSREHAAIAPRYLGLRVVLAKSFARIHRQNLINFGVLPLQFRDDEDYETLREGDTLELEDLERQLRSGGTVVVSCPSQERAFITEHGLSDRLLEVTLAGGLINWAKERSRGR